MEQISKKKAFEKYSEEKRMVFEGLSGFVLRVCQQETPSAYELTAMVEGAKIVLNTCVDELVKA